MQKSTQFKPGISGNPSGRSKSDIQFKELAKEHTETALMTLVEILKNEKAPPSARINSANALLSRAWGKPSLAIESVGMDMTFSEWCKLHGIN